MKNVKKHISFKLRGEIIKEYKTIFSSVNKKNKPVCILFGLKQFCRQVDL